MPIGTLIIERFIFFLFNLVLCAEGCRDYWPDKYLIINSSLISFTGRKQMYLNVMLLFNYHPSMYCSTPLNKWYVLRYEGVKFVNSNELSHQSDIHYAFHIYLNPTFTWSG